MLNREVYQQLVGTCLLCQMTAVCSVVSDHAVDTCARVGVEMYVTITSRMFVFGSTICACVRPCMCVHPCVCACVIISTGRDRTMYNLQTIK